MELKYCLNCGKFIDPELKKCPNCEEEKLFKKGSAGFLDKDSSWYIDLDFGLNKISNYQDFILKLKNFNFVIKFDSEMRFNNVNKKKEEYIKWLNEHKYIIDDNSEEYEIHMKYDKEEDEDDPFIELKINGKKKADCYELVKRILQDFYLDEILDSNGHKTNEYECIRYDNYGVYDRIIQIMKHPYLEKLIKAGFLREYIMEYKLNEDGKNEYEILGITKAQGTFLKKLYDEDPEITEKYHVYDTDSIYSIMRKNLIDFNTLKKSLALIKKNKIKNETVMKSAGRHLEYDVSDKLSFRSYKILIKSRSYKVN